MTTTMGEGGRLVLAPRVLLAFDDFSLAGRHLLHHVTLDAQDPQPLAQAASLPEELKDDLAIRQFLQNGQATLSVVTVTTATRTDAQLWQLADALVQFFSASDVETLHVVASLHLPQAKPRSEPIENVYQAAIGGDVDASTGVASLDTSWEIKDAFLTRLLHFARLEQAFVTQLLVAKGYKPGRDGAGTREAVATLAAALPKAVPGLTADVQQAVEDAYKTLASGREQQQPYNLLYQ